MITSPIQSFDTYMQKVCEDVKTFGILLSTGGGRVLLRERVLRSRPGVGLWPRPASHKEHGESVEDSSRKELFEETSLVGGIAGLFSVHTGVNHVEVTYGGSLNGEP